MKKIIHIDFQNNKEMPRVKRESETGAKYGYSIIVLSEGETYNDNNVTYLGFKKAKNRIRRFLFSSRNLANIASKIDADIVQLHSPELLLYAKKIKQTGKKVIFDSHEFYSKQILIKPYIPLFARNFISKLYGSFEKRMCSKVDAVIYPCTYDGKNIFEGYNRNMIKIENYSSSIEPKASTKKDNRVVYAGGLCEERGFFDMCEAILSTTGELVLCGRDISTEESKYIEEKDTDKIHYCGSLDRQALFDMYSTCSIGISVLHDVGQYSSCDNMSTKIYEYMQCGLPVIFSGFPFAKKVNDKYHFGIPVNPGNVHEISEAIQYLLDNPEEAKRMGDNGRRAVEQEFSWEIEEKKLLALYEAL